MPGLFSGAKVPGPGSNSLLLLSQGCSASPDPSVSASLTSLYSSPSSHSPQQPCCIPQSSAGHKGNLGQVPVNLKVTPMLVMSDRTIPFPELRPISSRALGCGGAGKVFLTWLSAARNIASHPTLLLGGCQSCPLWQAGLGSLPPPELDSLAVPPAGLGALSEAMVEQLGVVWHEALQPISH